jgi:hypothetical protein
MTTKTLSKSDLAQFTGTESWYRHGINRNVLYTDGAQHVAEHRERVLASGRNHTVLREQRDPSAERILIKVKPALPSSLARASFSPRASFDSTEGGVLEKQDSTCPGRGS